MTTVSPISTMAIMISGLSKRGYRHARLLQGQASAAPALAGSTCSRPGSAGRRPSSPRQPDCTVACSAKTVQGLKARSTLLGDAVIRVTLKASMDVGYHSAEYPASTVGIVQRPCNVVEHRNDSLADSAASRCGQGLHPCELRRSHRAGTVLPVIPASMVYAGDTRGGLIINAYAGDSCLRAHQAS